MSFELIDKKGRVLEKLINEDAIDTVKKISNVKRENRNGREIVTEDGVSSNNLRKFYDQFLKIYNSRVDYESKRIMLIMMKAHTHYSVRRLKYIQFNNFISERIDAVLSSNEEKDFNNKLKAFKMNFEAVVGYFKKD